MRYFKRLVAIGCNDDGNGNGVVVHCHCICDGGR